MEGVSIKGSESLIYQGVRVLDPRGGHQPGSTSTDPMQTLCTGRRVDRTNPDLLSRTSEEQWPTNRFSGSLRASMAHGRMPTSDAGIDDERYEAFMAFMASMALLTALPNCAVHRRPSHHCIDHGAPPSPAAAVAWPPRIAARQRATSSSTAASHSRCVPPDAAKRSTSRAAVLIDM